MADTTTVPTTRSSRRRAAPAAPPVPPEHTALAVPIHEPISASAAVAEAPAHILPPPVPLAAAAPSPLVQPPPPEPTLSNSPFRRHDVVQVIDNSSRHYGQFVTIGDVLHNKVHGYYMMPGLHKEHVTVEMHQCFYIGSAKIRSASPCSHKWIADKGRA